MGQMFYVPSNSCVKALTPKTAVLGGKDFERQLGLDEVTRMGSS